MIDEVKAEEDLALTISTYDEIAEQYHSRWQDRSPLKHLANRFISMLNVYGLTEELILDVGCGPGFDTAFFRQRGLRAVGLDLSHKMLQLGKHNYPGQYILADMRSLPFKKSIGGLWVSASMLHLPHSEVPAALNNFADVLVAGGLMYLSVKLGRGDEKRFQPYQTARYFAYHQPDELDILIREAGFHIVEGWQDEEPTNQTQWLIRFARKAPRSELKTLGLIK